MKSIHKYLYVLALCIFADVICDNLIVQTYGGLSRSTQNATLLTISGFVILYLALQIVVAPFQSGLSDFYCRKRSLLVALGFSFLSLIATLLYDSSISTVLLILFIILILKGFGNIIPISWAAIAEVQKKELRFALGIATSPYALGYIALSIFNKTTDKTTADFIALGILLILSLYVSRFFSDPNDIQKREERKKKTPLEKLKCEKTAIFQDFRDNIITTGLGTYLSWAISLYIILLVLVDFKVRMGADHAMIMMYGYLAGVVVLKFCKKYTNDAIICAGYVVTLVPLAAFIPLNYIFSDSSLLISIICFFSGMGNAYHSPSILTVLSKERQIHEQGRIFGLIDSADSFGFLIATVTILLFKLLSISTSYLVFASILVFVLSWIPYRRNVLLRRKKNEKL